SESNLSWGSPVTLVLILCAHSAVATAADDVRCKIRDRVQFRIPIRVTKQDDVRWNLEGYVAISNRKVVTEGHELLPDGSLVIMSALKNDSGNYTVDIFNQTGFWKRTEQFHLEIDGRSVRTAACPFLPFSKDDLVRKGNCQPAAEGNRSAEQFVPRAKDGISNRSRKLASTFGVTSLIKKSFR
uniref:Immunoglobulin I-set domain-containing protein n=1 Tax=Denticeps clupeoides TaxID=299321 RepID=A0AAY4B4W8_9TELE